MSIRVNVKELLEILAWTPREQNVLLVGRHGLGKSEILTRFYTGVGLRVVPLFLGQMSDPGDLIGLPSKDDGAGRTRFLAPYWWPPDGEPVALFLDELNRARPEILQSVHDLALNRTLAGRTLPEGSVVAAAINAGDDYQVHELDPALASRFNIYHFAPEVAEWLAWARGEGLDARVTDFIERHHEHLDGESEDPLEKAPDRRAWTLVARLLVGHEALTPTLAKAVAGIVGAPAALALRRFLADTAHVDPEDLLLRLDARLLAELGGLELQELLYLNRRALAWIEERAARLGPRRATVVRNVERYVAHLRGAGQTEVVADLINHLERAELAEASEVLLTSPALMEALADYIEKVRL